MKYYGAMILVLFVACSAFAADSTELTFPVVLTGSFLDFILGPEKSAPVDKKLKLEEGEAFLASNKNKKNVISLPSGLQYRIIKEGSGQKPEATDFVIVHYRGTLIN